MNNGADKSVNATNLPQNNGTKRAEVNQFPQPADRDVAKKAEEKPDPKLTEETVERTSMDEGLNEAHSPGTAGSFEGFENRHQEDDNGVSRNK